MLETRGTKMKILFSDEKYFDIDSDYNPPNDRVSSVSGDEKSDIKQRRNFPEKVMIWLGICFKRAYYSW